MIDHKELRIGNYILNEKREPCVVSGLTPHLVTLARIEGNVVVENRQLAYDDVYPIEITKDWLNKFGFIQKSHKWHDGSVSEDYLWLGKYNVGITEKDGIFFGREAHDKSAQWIANVEKLHQLQNHYFALTGTELNVEL